MIAGMTYYQIAWYFVLYSFLGWCVEVIFHAMRLGKIINRGFLCGPVCPVYGFGVLAVLAGSKALPLLLDEAASGAEAYSTISGTILLFFGGMLVTTAIELIAGWLLDVAFHARWWDYSDKPLNFHGYICLRFSILWGLAVVVVVRLLQPAMESSSRVQIPQRIGWPLLAVLYAAYLADFIVTVLIIIGLNKRLARLDELQKKMRVVSDGLSSRIGESSLKAQQAIDETRVQTHLAKEHAGDVLAQKKEEAALKIDEQKAAMAALRGKILAGSVFGSGRILRAFPTMKHRQFNEALLSVLKERKE